MATLKIDTRDLVEVMNRLEVLPEKMQHKVLSRAVGRAKNRVIKRYVQLASERMNIYQKPIRDRMSARFGAGVLTVYVSSEQIPLAKLGAKVLKGRMRRMPGGGKERVGGGVKVQGPRGPKGVLRGSYLKAFEAGMSSGHKGIFKRVPGSRMRTKNKEAIKELYGPNPAGEIVRNPGEYHQMLEELFQTEILGEIEKGVVGMLRTVG